MNVSKMKRLLSCLLALTMPASIAFAGSVAAYADEIHTVTMEPTDIDKQLDYIHSQVGSLMQDSSKNTWYYTVTDLDHTGIWSLSRLLSTRRTAPPTCASGRSAMTRAS